ncbi:hypothetical protein Acr_17g0006030 [Actinidia rufa]|uniref:Uncharacterized protein n=1 Tax=Actinidia rufa TaxID=165716 RepID=A0A7J0G2M3_9ERIC|nr:hypothetical protein Acr_17g0006030 [Actinidia rufa]
MGEFGASGGGSSGGFDARRWCGLGRGDGFGDVDGGGFITSNRGRTSCDGGGFDAGGGGRRRGLMVEKAPRERES